MMSTVRPKDDVCRSHQDLALARHHDDRVTGDATAARSAEDDDDDDDDDEPEEEYSDDDDEEEEEAEEAAEEEEEEEEEDDDDDDDDAAEAEAARRQEEEDDDEDDEDDDEDGSSKLFERLLVVGVPEQWDLDQLMETVAAARAAASGSASKRLYHKVGDGMSCDVMWWMAWDGCHGDGMGCHAMQSRQPARA